MNILEQKTNCIISAITGVFSALFGQFWFLFAFLLGLNIMDYITGILKARYLKIESSKMAMKGFIKKFLIWCLVALGFGLGIVFEQLGQVLKIDLKIMLSIWFILAHCILNEIRSILENMVQLDKGYLVPKWLIKGLVVTHKLVNENLDNAVDTFNDTKKGA